MRKTQIGRMLGKVPGILSLMLIGVMAPGLSGYALGTANQDKHDKQKKSASAKAKTELVDERDGGQATLWKDPGEIESLDLFNGAGGAEGAPDLSGTFTFVRRSTSGTTKKIIVKDDKDRKWTVKFGVEAKPEIAATRILWAMGYHVDQDYFVKRAHIRGWSEGDVVNVRFERGNDGYDEVGLWDWRNNLFNGRREMDGLKILMVLMNNWDLKSDNNKVLRRHGDGTADAGQTVYYVSDLGSSFGSTGSLARRLLFFADPPAGTKGESSDYSHQNFINGVTNGEVRFHYKGKDPGALKGISVESAKWMGVMLGRLSEKQLGDAFRAAGFEDRDVAVYVRAMKERIGELRNLQ